MTHVLEILRAINVPLLMASTIALALRVNDRWDTLPRGSKFIFAGSVLLFANGMVASAVRYVKHAPVDFFTAITTGICLLVLTGVWLLRHQRATDDS